MGAAAVGSAPDNEKEVGSEGITSKFTRNLRCKEKVGKRRSLGWKEESFALYKSGRGLGTRDKDHHTVSWRQRGET